MKIHVLISAALCVSLLGAVPGAFGFETDQYALPPRPLADIGDEVSSYVNEQVSVAIASVNADIDRHEACVKAASLRDGGCESLDKEQKKLLDLRSPDAVAKAVYKLLGEGSLFTTATGKWFGKHKFAHEPSHYKPGYSDSIFITMPINYATLSPTVRMYGSEFGFDKIDHFFQQGYRYYTIYEDAIARGQTPEAAARKAIDWGKRTERTYFGMLVSGVYSNGDLFANYAGMKFYQRLTRNVVAGGVEISPLVELRDGRWHRLAAADTLRPLIGDQMNEALNASGFSIFLKPVVKRIVRDKDCLAWRTSFPNATPQQFDDLAAKLETWDGEDYGFTKKSRTVKISSCFEKN